MFDDRLELDGVPMRQVESIRARAGGPVETFVLPAPCGHSPHSLRADEVLAAMATFLRGLDVSTPAPR